jgi:hypothetical protein
MLDSLWKIVERHRYTVAALAICVVLVGCELWSPRVASPIDGKPVTRAQLLADAQGMLAKFEAAESTLADKEAMKNRILAVATQLGSGITDPFGIVPTLLGALAIGASGDNIRKNGKINELKAEMHGIANGAGEAK